MTSEEHWTLFRADPRATPFQSPAWLDAWWTHLGGGERVDVEARDDGGRLIAALPMFVWYDAGVRRLVPVGATQSDYLDALVDPAVPGAREALWRAILATADRWDELVLHDVREGAALLGEVRVGGGVLTSGATQFPGEGRGPVTMASVTGPLPSQGNEGLPEGWHFTDTPCEICPVLPLPPAPPLLPQLSKTQRRKVVHDRHRAEALGGVTVAFAGADEIDDALTALFELHEARWRLEGEEGVLASPRVQAFHRAAAPALAAAGLLRMPVVRHAGRIVSLLLGFADARRGYSYVIGSDFSVPKQSFGTLAFAHLIEACVEEGAREFHFLRGEEGYKYGWGAEPTRTMRRVVRRG